MNNRSSMGFEVRVLFHERVAIEPILERFQKEVLKPKGLLMNGAFMEEWTAFITRAGDRAIQDADRQAVFKWFKQQHEVAKCTVELPTRIRVREMRELIWSLV